MVDIQDDFYLAVESADDRFGIILEPLNNWHTLEQSEAWFSEFHDGRNKCFELPFVPGEFLYSSIHKVPVNKNAKICGHYKRGVKKFVNLLEKNEIIPPVTYVWRNNSWTLEDGCHRYEAHLIVNKDIIMAIFAYPLK